MKKTIPSARHRPSSFRRFPFWVSSSFSSFSFFFLFSVWIWCGSCLLPLASSSSSSLWTILPANEDLSSPNTPPRLSKFAWAAVPDPNGEGSQLVAFGGFRSAGSGIALITGDIYLVNSSSLVWTRRARASDWPSVRQDHAYFVFNHSLYIHGGFSGSTFLSDLWRYSPNTNQWVQVETSGAIPLGRYGHSISVHEESNVAILYGGVLSTGSTQNTAHQLDLLTNTWTALANAPFSRLFHSAVFLSECMYVFGGTTIESSQTFSSHFRYCLDAQAWNQLTQSVNHPIPRHAHAAIVQADRIFLHGGYTALSSPPLDTVVEYDAVLDRWYTPEISGTPPPARFDHAIARDENSRLFIFGGSNGNSLLSDLYMTNYRRPQCPAGQFSSAGTSICSNCAAGYHSPNPGAYSCDICPAGTYTNGAGQSTCLSCPAGSYGENAGSGSLSDCTLCPLGRFGNMSAQTSSAACFACLQGQYSDQLGSTSCQICSPGTASSHVAATSSSTCATCSAGTFSGAGAAECTACDAGSFSTSMSSSCTLCGPGEYSNAQASSCSDCPPGTRQPNSGGQTIAACLSCIAGEYQPSPRSTSCLQCPEGTSMLPHLSGQSDLGACQPCPLGTHQPTVGSTECLSCPEGTFQNQTQQTFCYDCPIGTYNPAQRGENIDVCLPCPSGSFGSTPGLTSASQCTQCPPGSWGGDGVSSCIPCIPGTYSNMSGEISFHACRVCPPNSASVAGSASCSSCPSDSFAHVGFASCIACNADQDTISHSGWILNGFMSYLDATSGSANQLERWITSLESNAVPYSVSTSVFQSSPYSMEMAVTSPSQFVLASQRVQIFETSPLHYQVRISSRRSASLVGDGTWRAVVRIKHSHLFQPEEVVLSFDTSLVTWQTLSFSRAMTTGSLDWIDFELFFGGFTTGTVYFDDVLMIPSPDLACNCSSGHYYEEKRRGICQYCEIGSSCISSARYSCDLPGFHSFGGQSVCFPCPPGWICSGGVASPCPTGTYIFNNTECLPCPQNASCRDGRLEFCGFGKRGSGDRHCIPCIPSTFSDTSATTICSVCPDGQTSNFYRSQCEDCPRGYYSSGGNACRPCEVGHIQPLRGQSSCIPCSIGSYSPQEGSSECTPCPIGMTTVAGGAADPSACIAL